MAGDQLTSAGAGEGGGLRVDHASPAADRDRADPMGPMGAVNAAHRSDAVGEVDRVPVVDDGARLGPYRLLHRLGEGGMGVVHLGLDRAGRAVAVKVLREHIAHDPDARARLTREVSSLRRVRHPLVAEVLDADVEGDQPYVVTRFVPGPGLDAVVRDQGPMLPGQLTVLGRGLSDALGAIHAAGVVHRDLKPGNVLMLDGRPVVIDFGIAHVADDVRLTSVGLVMGTPGYLSPEVIDGEPVGRATDWWGWAATLAFAATGRPPYGRGPMDVVIDRVRRGQCDLQGVDARLQPLLLAALDVEPQRRPDAAEVLHALDRYAAGEEATVTVAQPSATRRLPSPATQALPAAAPDRPRTDEPAGTPDRPWWVPRTGANPQGRSRTGASPTSPYAPVAPAVGPSSLARPLAAAPPVGTAALAPHGSSPYGPAAPDGLDPALDAPGPRPRRNGTLLALLAAAVGAGVGWPTITAAVVAVLMVVARTVDRSGLAFSRRRSEHGRRRSDVALAVVCSPWHLVAGLVMTALALVLPAMMGVATAFSASLLVTTAAGSPAPSSLPAVGAGVVVALLVSWWGPGGGSLRRGTRSTVRGLVPRSAVVVVVLLLLAIGAGAALLAVTRGAPDWTPLVRLPFGLTLG